MGYMVTSIVIDKADEIAKVLSGRYNQEGYEGWELVQWNIMPSSFHEGLPPLLVFSNTSHTPYYFSSSKSSHSILS